VNKPLRLANRRFGASARGLLLILLLLLCSCAKREDPQLLSQSAIKGGQAQPQGGPVYTDALGRSYAVKAYPRRIVCLAPAITEILFAIGAGDRVVGVTQYCDYPPEAATRTKVGGFSGATVSMEQIRLLNPDLVILSAEMHSRIVSLLDDLGIPSFAVEPRNFSEVYDVIALLGDVTGFSDGAEKVIAGMKSRIAAVEDQVRGTDQKSVFWILGTDPLMTAGSENFISEAIRLGGGKNIFDDIKERWPLVSAEQVLLRKPEWIFMGDDMTGAAMPENVIPANLRVQSIPAVKEKRIAVIKGDLVYRYGPRLAEAVEVIAGILHGTDNK